MNTGRMRCTCCRNTLTCQGDIQASTPALLMVVCVGSEPGTEGSLGICVEALANTWYSCRRGRKGRRMGNAGNSRASRLHYGQQNRGCIANLQQCDEPAWVLDNQTV